MKYKTFLKDTILNIFASGIVVILLQLIVYPFLSKVNNISVFGEILVIMAIINIVGVLYGSSLSNLKLKYHSHYLESKSNGDFLPLLLISTIFNAFTTTILFKSIISQVELRELIIYILLAILTMLRSYMVVEYRLSLNFNKILIHGIIYSFGLILGIYVFEIISIWYLIFLIAETLSFVYLIFTTVLLKEPFIKTKNFKTTIINFLYLCLSNSIKNTILYLDRLILFPLLGSYQVAVFFAATVIGKMTSFVLSPISGVVLSYLSREQKKLKVSFYLKINGIIIIFVAFISVLTVISSIYVVPLLYSDLYKDTIDILLVANIAVVIRASTILPQTIVLKYAETYYQVFIQIVDILLYLGLGICFLYFWGLKGFCFGMLFSSIVLYCINFILGYKSICTSN